jgi:GxxExxY protein
MKAFSPPSTPRAPSMEEKERLDSITRRIIGAAIEVHRRLGPGLLESAYETCLAFELRQMGLKIEEQKPLPVVYRDVKLDCGYRLDLVGEDSVVVEIKAVDQLAPIHVAQLLSYLRLSNRRVGLLINFHVRVLKNGLKRIVNDFPDSAFSATSAVEKEFED